MIPIKATGMGILLHFYKAGFKLQYILICKKKEPVFGTRLFYIYLVFVSFPV
jgi:hypothetical protein